MAQMILTYKLSPSSKLPKEIFVVSLARNMQTDLLYEPRQANLCLRAFRHDKF